jgi:hypothetical protein
MATAVPYIAYGVMAAGAAVAAGSQIQQAKFKKQESETNALIAAQNAEIARQEAEETRKVGEFEVAREGRRKRILIGKQRVAQAASGLTGRTQDIVIADTERQSAIDAALIRKRFSGTATGLEREGVLFETESARRLREGAFAKKSGRLRATGTILSGAGTAFGKYRSFQKQGV